MEVRVIVESSELSIASSGLYVSYEVERIFDATWLEHGDDELARSLGDALGWVREQLKLRGYSVSGDFVYQDDANVLVAEVTKSVISRDLVKQVFADLGVPDATSAQFDLDTNVMYITHGVHTAAYEIEEA